MERDETKYRYWRCQIDKWEASGLSQVAYCRQAHLKASTFCYWLAEIRKEKARATTSMLSGHQSIKLIPTRVEQANLGAVTHSDWIVRSPSGWEIRHSGDESASWLIALLKAFACGVTPF